jgi:hypothetical protein
MSNSFKCPRCGTVSYLPHDLEEGYCGHCHDWTASPHGIVWPFVSRRELEDLEVVEVPDRIMGNRVETERGEKTQSSD